MYQSLTRLDGKALETGMVGTRPGAPLDLIFERLIRGIYQPDIKFGTFSQGRQAGGYYECCAQQYGHGQYQILAVHLFFSFAVLRL
jgi:hypothetical protein